MEFHLPEGVADAVSALTQWGDTLGLVEIKRLANSRSAAQNALFWVMVGAIADYYLADKDDIHDMICQQFLPPIVVFDPIGKRDVMLPGRTSTLDVEEFTELLQKVQALLDEQGIPMAANPRLVELADMAA